MHYKMYEYKVKFILLDILGINYDTEIFNYRVLVFGISVIV